ncbi:MAG TPA: XrtA/PEP-CTERM system histidine kinase PrsK [Burkholderiaceae bacterium]|nr:XrtA/PEP-CTERM system histidine kinase PrsK [Burkholderiaceae bacterium]
MNPNWHLNPAVWSYGIAALAFSIFSIQLVAARRGRQRAAYLLAGIVLSAAWAACATAYSLFVAQPWWHLVHFFDALRIGTFLAFLLVVTMRTGRDSSPGGVHPQLPRARLFGLAAFVLLTLVVAEPPPVPLVGESRATTLAFGLLLARTVLGLVLVEQLFRRTQPSWRWNVRPLCLGLAGLFLYDLVLFADALLYRGMDPNIWTARGVVDALVIPLLALAATRNRDWNLAVSMSRSFISGSTALFASGSYLLAIAGVGYYVRDFGGSWGRALEIVLLFGALLLLVLVLVSGTFRSKLRVLTSKHFFAYRYDYREEWLRITQALSAASATTTPQLCIRALAELVESPGGALWLRRGDDGFVPTAELNMSLATAVEPLHGGLAEFISRTGWVVDLDEFRARPGAYLGFEAPEWLAAIPGAWLVVPLPNGEALSGFVVLARPRVRIELNWEVLDLLKTAGHQVGSYLALLQAGEALLEARKFEAFNRMSAFVVHDLKNLVAQLQLLLHNAQRHHDNPDFQRDMLGTVEHVAGRMNQLMKQLRAGATPVESPQSIDLATIARRVQANRARVGGGVELDLDLGVYVVGHQDRLERVVGHLVQNAVDAVGDNPRVRIRVFRSDQEGVVEIADNGVGMTPEFVRERLFRPFQTTKKLGMGIGAYESLQYVNALGGRITVESEPGRGTTVSVRLPIAVELQLKIAQEESA